MDHVDLNIEHLNNTTVSLGVKVFVLSSHKIRLRLLGNIYLWPEAEKNKYEGWWLPQYSRGWLLVDWD